jgi:hypothetical protein
MAKYIVVIPERSLVLVYQNHAEEPDDMTKLTEEEYSKLPAPVASQIERLFSLILQAKP